MAVPIPLGAASAEGLALGSAWRGLCLACAPAWGPGCRPEPGPEQGRLQGDEGSQLAWLPPATAGLLAGREGALRHHAASSLFTPRLPARAPALPDP